VGFCAVFREHLDVILIALPIDPGSAVDRWTKQLMVSAVSRPPSQKTRGQGTHSFETGRKDFESWATRQCYGRIDGWIFS
jgi:hypothetical protein